MGNSETVKGLSLVLMIEPCSGTAADGSPCNPDPRSQLKGKSMILYTNQKRLKTNITDTEDIFETEAKFIWVPVGPEVIENNYFSLTTNKVKARENIFRPFYSFKEEEKDLYHLKRGRTVGYKESGPGPIAAITIERDMDLYIQHIRIENGIAQLVGLTGGIALIAYILFFFLEYCWSIRKFKDYMASELYYTPEDVLAMEGAGAKVDNLGVSGKRSFINRSFHNEIIGEEEKTLNKAKVNMCCRVLS